MAGNSPIRSLIINLACSRLKFKFSPYETVTITIEHPKMDIYTTILLWGSHQLF